jgi:hypothetical protein
MAGTGGYRPGAGRPKGAVNKRTIAMQEKVTFSGHAPLDVLIGAMRYYYERAQAFLAKAMNEPPKEAADLDKLDAAIDHAFDKASEHAARAAGYIHPRMSPMDLNSRFDMMRLTYDERRELARLLSKGLGLGDAEHNGALQLEHDEREPTV